MKKGFKQPFGWAPNTIINDPLLTLKAKGLWLYINSKPEGWEFSTRGVTIQNKDGKDGVNSGLKELEKFGYLHRAQKQSAGGQFAGYDWVLYDSPGERSIPLTDSTVTGKTADGETDTSNKEKVKQSLSKKEIGGKINFATTSFKKWDLIAFQDSIQEASDGKGYPREELIKFYNYWREPSATKKMRFQLQQTWETKGRLVTWMSKADNFNKREKRGQSDGFQQIIDKLGA